MTRFFTEHVHHLRKRRVHVPAPSSATPATNTPGSLQAEMTDRSKASLCVRRPRRRTITSIVPTIEFDGHNIQ
jgi:hypothetical protein